MAQDERIAELLGTVTFIFIFTFILTFILTFIFTFMFIRTYMGIGYRERNKKN